MSSYLSCRASWPESPEARQQIRADRAAAIRLLVMVLVGVSMVMISDWQTRGATVTRATADLPEEEPEIEMPVPPLGVEVPVREPVGGSKR